MAWRKKPGLSQVRPAMRAILVEDVAPEKSDPLSTDAWNWTPFASVSYTHLTLPTKA